MSIARELAQFAPADAAPTRRRYLVNDSTVEKLGEILAANPNGVLIFRDELIGLLKTMDREGHESDRAFYLTAWNGDSRYTYDRIGRGTTDIEAAIVSIVGGIQPGPLAEYLRGAVRGGHGDDGLMQRFQVTVYPDVPKTWNNVDRAPDPDARADAYKALQRLADLVAGDVEAQRDNFERDALPYLRFEPAAQDRFDEWREQLEQRLRRGDEHPALESHLAKYRSLIPSLALILHLLGGGVGPVGLEALERAIAWGVYLETHARRLYASVTNSPAVSARALAKRIEAGSVSSPFAARDVYRNGWADLDREQTAAAIDVLLSLNWLEERVEGTAGRNRTVYVINPKVAIRAGSEPTKLTEAPSVSSGSSSPEAFAESGDEPDVPRVVAEDDANNPL
jgi:putative DNA primase/helicase